MDRIEAIDILRVIAPPRTSKKAFYDFMEARDMAIAALEKADANHPEIPDSCNAETVEAIPLDWIRAYINNLKDMGVQLSLRDAQAVSVMVDKWAMEQSGNATCGPDYCEIGGMHND